MKLGGAVALCCALIGSQAWASEKPEWNYLYRLSGQGRNAYVLGGGHVGFPAVGSGLSACVRSAADKADVLVLEGNLLDIMSSAAAAQKTLPLLSKAMEGLSVEEQIKVRSLIVPLKPEQVSVLVGDQLVLSIALRPLLGAAPSKAAGADIPLFAEAVRATKRIGALESAEDQESVLAKVPIPVWQAALSQHLALIGDAEKAKAHWNAIKAMARAIMLGNEAEILRTRQQAESGWETFMTEERNPQLAERIDQMLGRLDKASVFFALGGAHLAGPGGVVARLRERGYILEQICK